MKYSENKIVNPCPKCGERLTLIPDTMPDGYSPCTRVRCDQCNNYEKPMSEYVSEVV